MTPSQNEELQQKITSDIDPGNLGQQPDYRRGATPPRFRFRPEVAQLITAEAFESFTKKRLRRLISEANEGLKKPDYDSDKFYLLFTEIQARTIIYRAINQDRAGRYFSTSKNLFADLPYDFQLPRAQVCDRVISKISLLMEEIRSLCQNSAGGRSSFPNYELTVRVDGGNHAFSTVIFKVWTDHLR